MYSSAPLYFVYCMYPPLYMAGPIMTFNSFASQALAPLPIRRWQVLLYGARWLAAWAALEALTHTVAPNAMAKHRVLDYLSQRGMLITTPLHYACVGFWVLVFMWLKFLVIWRFFRLAALAAGSEPPENMLRCVCNNYDVEVGVMVGWGPLERR